MQPLTPGPTYGRYQVGAVELTSGDLIEFLDAGQVVGGRVEHDGFRYIVVVSESWRLPLAEIVQARYIGNGRL